MSTSTPPFTILLIGGASGVGKTSISYRIAHHYGVGITEVDDFIEVLKRMTTPEQQPVIHYWDSRDPNEPVTVEEILENGLDIGQVMMPALEAVIANHIDTNVPIVLEGDFILPVLAVQPSFGDFPNTGHVKAVFIYEPDEAQIVVNYLQREPHEGPQEFRAHVSWLKNEWLKEEAERLGVPVLPSRPWETLFERLVAILENGN